MKRIVIGIGLLSLLTTCSSIKAGSGQDIKLTTGGKTDYIIVSSNKASAVDQYAVRVLADYLKRITKADFPVVKASEAGKSKSCIYVGTGNTAALKKQEFVVESRGPDIYLYGEGKHGTLNAVMDFLGGKLGWRWYSQFEKPVFPDTPTVTLKPFSYKKQYSFLSRHLPAEPKKWNCYDFLYQNGINDGLEAQFRKRGLKQPPHLISDTPTEFGCHTPFRYIPPNPNSPYVDKRKIQLKCLAKLNYFATNPEYFSLSSTGKRVQNRQLCYSNPELRKELTKNIMKCIDDRGTNQYITIDAADHPGRFCDCKGCKALEKKYQSPAGPLFDYLLEFCDIIKKRHPGMLVKTYAYRRDQSQKAPVLPDGKKLPGNLIVEFAPIDDCYFADWTHPDKEIQDTYNDLKSWSKLTGPGNRLWVLIYPNPYRTGAVMPVGNIERLVNMLRLMHQAGARGICIDHNGIRERSGFSELQEYLIIKLSQDINRDADALIKEFTDHQFGSAAPTARKYMKELEQGRKDMVKLPPGVRYRSSNFDLVTFPYLTTENIHRWQTYFDEMEKVAAGNPRNLQNVRLMRRELDTASLWRWFDLQKAYPDYFADYRKFAKRINSANSLKAPAGFHPYKLDDNAMKDFLVLIQAGNRKKPLPAQFAGIDEKMIRRFIPVNHNYYGERTALDKDATFGYAATVHRPDLPFHFGFYSSSSPSQQVKIEKNQITPGTYKLYKLGNIVVAPASSIWFSAASRRTSLDLGSRLYEPGEDNTWEAYASLKFDGPAYGGKGRQNTVLCDQVILVRKF